MARGLKREVISRGYNLLLRVILSARFSDAQCGFKAGRAEAIRELLPDVKDDAWFVEEGKLRYVLTGGAGGFGGPGAGGGTAAAVTAWVEQNCTAVPASAYGGSAVSASGSAAARAVAAAVAQRLYRCG